MKLKSICLFNKAIILLCILIYMLFFLSFSKSFLSNILKNGKELIYDEKSLNINESFNKAKPFLDKCFRGLLIKNKTIIPTKIPISSAIIPIFNSKNIIERAIRSIQNQNIENLEIILINDFSTDNTSLIIEQLKKQDRRIKVINNKKNMGTLYSRCIGVLSSLGKYIFHLDSDDMFLDRDIFSIMINITNFGNFDFISFKAISTFNSDNVSNNIIYDYTDANNNLIQILYQPQLGLHPLRPGKTFDTYIVEDNYLWNKCIKAKIYRKVLKAITKNRFSRYMVYEEDRLINYVLFNFAERMKYLEKYGILIFFRKGSMTRRKYKRKKKYFLSKLYYADIIIEFSKKSFLNKKVIVHLIIYLLNMLKFNRFEKLDESNKNLFISCINRCLSNKYIKKEDKKKIMETALSLIFQKNNI